MTPIRCCSLCKKRNSKSELYRIISVNNIAVLDEDQKHNSRGIYLCKNDKCIQNLIKVIEKSKYNSKISINNESLKELLKSLFNRMGE